MTTYGDKNYQKMVKKFGDEVASDIQWLVDSAGCLHQPLNETMLVEYLRRLARGFDNLADEVEKGL